jgi:hypothetical protein
MTAHCTCAFEDVPGSPCVVHPNGCEHGKMWNETCDACYQATWRKVLEVLDCFYCHGNGVQQNGMECPLGCSAPQLA